MGVATLVIALLVLWAIAQVTAYTLGGLVHLLLVAAVVIVIWKLVRGRSGTP
jgi:hypothetical protein